MRQTKGLRRKRTANRLCHDVEVAADDVEVAEDLRVHQAHRVLQVVDADGAGGAAGGGAGGVEVADPAAAGGREQRPRALWWAGRRC